MLDSRTARDEKEGIARLEAMITAQRSGWQGSDGRPFVGALLSRTHCRRDSPSVFDIMRLMIKASSLPVVLCVLQPCCRKRSKIARVVPFVLLSRDAKTAVVVAKSAL